MSKNRRHDRLIIPLSLAIYKQGEALLDQQMCCWGCDVRRAEGNLLLAYGFEKRPSPNPRFHSAYTLPVCATCALTVWGWGLWVADSDHGSVFMSRSRFQFAYTTTAVFAPCASQANDLPLFPNSSDADKSSVYALMAQACRLAASYEAWLLEHVGVDYREMVNAAWPERRRQKGGIPAGSMARAWLDLAQHFGNSLTQLPT